MTALLPNVPGDLVAQLATYRFAEVRIVDPTDLTDDERLTLPTWWAEAASLTGPAAARRATAQWRDAVPGLFTATLAFFDDRAAGVFIGRETGAASKALILGYAPSLLVRLPTHRSPRQPHCDVPPGTQSGFDESAGEAT